MVQEYLCFGQNIQLGKNMWLGNKLKVSFFLLNGPYQRLFIKVYLLLYDHTIPTKLEVLFSFTENGKILIETYTLNSTPV